MATVNVITAEADDYGFSHLSSARKISLLNQAYQRINSYEAWPYLQALDSTVDYTDETVTSPTNFLRVLAAHTDVATAGSRSPIEYAPLAQLEAMRYSDLSATSVQARYYFYQQDPENSSTVMGLWPGLGSGISGTFHCRYIRRAPDLASGGAESTILLPARHHALLRYRYLFELFLLEKDVNMSEHFRSLGEEAWQVAKRDLLEESYDPDFIVFDNFNY